MDRDVLRVGRELALCTLDVQLDALYLTLEEEVRQFLDVEAGAEISGKEPAAELAQVCASLSFCTFKNRPLRVGFPEPLNELVVYSCSQGLLTLFFPAGVPSHTSIG